MIISKFTILYEIGDNQIEFKYSWLFSFQLKEDSIIQYFWEIRIIELSCRNKAFQWFE